MYSLTNMPSIKILQKYFKNLLLTRSTTIRFKYFYRCHHFSVSTQNTTSHSIDLTIFNFRFKNPVNFVQTFRGRPQQNFSIISCQSSIRLLRLLLDFKNLDHVANQKLILGILQYGKSLISVVHIDASRLFFDSQS